MNDLHGKTLFSTEAQARVEANPNALLLATLLKEVEWLKKRVRVVCPKAVLGPAVVVLTDHGLGLGLYYEDPGVPGHVQYHNMLL